MFSGKVNIDEAASASASTIEREGFETVGGFLLSHLGRMPTSARRSTIDDVAVEVLEVERRRIHKVRMRRSVGADAQSATGTGSPPEPPSADEGRLRRAPRPAQRRQVDAAERARRQKVAIVSDKPQTTRTRILGVKNTPTAQMVFVDTPGVHRPLHRLNVRMVDAALEAMRRSTSSRWSSTPPRRPGKGTDFCSTC